MNTKDVIYTPFMNRVAADEEAGETAVVTSESRSIARAVRDWVEMRGMAEYVVAQANSMLAAGVERVELEDEAYALAFTVRHGTEWVRLALLHESGIGRLDLDRSWARHGDVEPAAPEVLEEIVITLLHPKRVPGKS